MNKTRFDDMLKNQLDDPTGAKFTTTMREVAMSNSVRSYSRYFPLFKPYGTGHVYADAASGQKDVTLVGGPFIVGQTITLDPLGPSPEEIVIGSVAEGATDNLVGTPVVVTAVSNLVNSWPAGTEFNLETRGLGLVQNQRSYPLPNDFLMPDQETFDLSVGARAQIKRTSQYYDALYDVTQALSGVGFGGRQNFGYGRGYPILGNPLNNPNSGANNSTQAMNVTTFRFLVHQAKPRLEVTPAPSVNQTLDFYYYSTHIIETVPDADLDGIMALAKYYTYEAKLAKRSASLRWTVGDTTQEPEAAQWAIQTAMDRAWKEWEAKIRKRPLLISG